MSRSDSDPDSLVDLYFNDSESRGRLALGDHDSLLDLVVMAVEPAPDASRLQVTLTAPPGASLDELSASLELARGQLRSEVARSLQRKRTPELRFVLAREGEP